VDDQLVAFSRDEDDNFEQVRGAIGADDQPSVWVFAEVVGDYRVVSGVEDVVVSDAVAASGRVDHHNDLLYYETPQ
jgi:hypothetical protein